MSGRYFTLYTSETTRNTFQSHYVKTLGQSAKVTVMTQVKEAVL